MVEKDTEDDETSDAQSDDKPEPQEAKPTTGKPAAAKPGPAKPSAAKPATATAAEKPADPAARRKGVQPVAIHGPDSFIDRLQPYVKHIAIGALALFAVIGAFVGWGWMKRRSAAKDTAHVAEALAIGDTQVRPADSPPPPYDRAALVEGAPKFTTAKDKATAGADAMAAAGKVAGTAAVYRAALLVDAGKLDDAEALYRAHTSDPGVDGAMAREGLGYVLEARAAAAKDPGEQDKLYHQALDAFKDEQPDDAGPRRDFALYEQARILVLLGKPADAKTALDAALKAVPDSEIKQEIQERLALLGGS